MSKQKSNLPPSNDPKMDAKKSYVVTIEGKFWHKCRGIMRSIEEHRTILSSLYKVSPDDIVITEETNVIPFNRSKS